MQIPTLVARPLRGGLDSARSPRLRRWGNLGLRFLVGQGSVQALNILTGFFLLRWMSVEAYAQYSVAFGFQSTLGMLVDLGFSGSIIALVGERGAEPEIVGRYVRSARHFRNRLFLIVVPLGAVAFPFLIARQNWPVMMQALLFASIVAALYFQGWSSFYSTPLLITQRITPYYRPQIISACGRNIFCFVLHLMSALTAWAAAWVSSAVIFINSLLYRKESKHLAAEPTKADRQANREMLRYLSPLIPVTIFLAFQGQISIFIITLTGQTRGVAEVAALGRLGQLFLVLGAFNSVVISPYSARVPRSHLARRYFQMVGAAVAISAVICLGAFLFPEPFLWILGPKYQNLRAEVGWAIAVSCVNYVGGVIWAIHSARKWIYWWVTVTYICLVLAAQVVCALLIDLSTTMHVIYFSLVTVSAILITHIAGGIYGFVHGPRAAPGRVEPQEAK
jgi:O-antigen/teichoic acid export membrane protein